MSISNATLKKQSKYYVASVLSVMVFLVLNVEASFAQSRQQRTFTSAEAATTALFLAVQQDDAPGLVEILDPGNELASSGDAIQDRLEHHQFVQKYQEMHRLVREPDNTVVLYVGAENWPFPVPLVSNRGIWRFDSGAGSNEVLARRIGENEAMVLGTFPLLILAEQEFQATPRKIGDVPHYANYFKLTNATPNALYTGADSAISEALAVAGLDGATGGNSAVPFYGYYFRILTRQGKHAAGGAKNYMDGSRMTGGFAFIAYPAQYRHSGVKTFIAGPNGKVYEKDLGPDTAKIASTMSQYDPDSSWDYTEQFQEPDASPTKAASDQ